MVRGLTWAALSLVLRSVTLFWHVVSWVRAVVRLCWQVGACRSSRVCAAAGPASAAAAVVPATSSERRGAPAALTVSPAAVGWNDGGRFAGGGGGLGTLARH